MALIAELHMKGIKSVSPRGLCLPIHRMPNSLKPGASGGRITTNASDYLHVLVLRSNNAKELIGQRNKL